MPSPNKLSMRNPSNLTSKENPLDPKTVAERFINKLEEEKLKSPQTAPSAPSNIPIKYIVGPNQKILDTIENRLSSFYPKIVLGEHIVNDWKRVVQLSKDRFLPVVVHRNTLEGIDFIVEDRFKLLCAIRNATANKKPAFVEGTRSDWKKHWALTLSFLATNGIGFREIYRPRINDRPLEDLHTLPFDNRLGTDISVDVSSLHLAISEFPDLKQTRCNVHIDQLTVTLGGLGDDVSISPTALGHAVNELLLKTILQGKLPDWILDAFDISLLNPYEGFLNAGIQAAIINKSNFKWTIKYSAGLNNNTNLEWSGNFKFQNAISTGIVITF